MRRVESARVEVFERSLGFSGELGETVRVPKIDPVPGRFLNDSSWV
jgi:hypothetical protein